MAKYLACGNIMLDGTIDDSGNIGKYQLGGPALYAYSGMRLFSDDVKLVGNIGCDYQEYFNDFFLNNKCDLSGLNILNLPTIRSFLKYYPDGSYDWLPDNNMDLFEFKYSNLLKNIDENTECIYLFMYPKDDFFNHIKKIKDKYKFKIMWEYGSFSRTKLEDSFEELKYVDYLSLNRTDASAAFNTDKYDDLTNIKIIQKLPVKYTYYRVGDKGAYLINKDWVYYCPVYKLEKNIDPSGCGNSTTAALMLGLNQTKDPITSLAMAAAIGAINASDYGVIKDLSSENKNQAKQLVQLVKSKVIKIS